LRERVGDILSLAEYFLGIYSQRLDLPVPLISEAAQRVLEHHSWPGNTRELENVIHFALLVSSGDEILPEHLNLPVVDSPLEQVRRIYAQASPAEQATLRQFLHEQNGIST
jgi:transcriptional regulator with AAA-type ATPase domain